jgi:predicted lipid-binding transport protein (Tim44 family)
MALVAGLVIFALLRLFMRPRTNPGGQPLQYSGVNGGQVMREPVMREPALQPLSPGAPSAAPLASAAPAQSGVQLPKGFDAAGFLRQAKLNFIRLQQANDQGDLDTLREVTTDEMYQSIVAERGSIAAPQATDVVNLEASLLEVSTEGEMHWASVRFGGNIREDGRDAAPFQEIWHLQKPVSGNTGWLLAGIQQVS